MHWILRKLHGTKAQTKEMEVEAGLMIAKKCGKRKDKHIFVNDILYSIDSSTLLKMLDNN